MFRRLDRASLRAGCAILPVGLVSSVERTIYLFEIVYFSFSQVLEPDRGRPLDAYPGPATTVQLRSPAFVWATVLILLGFSKQIFSMRYIFLLVISTINCIYTYARQ